MICSLLFDTNCYFSPRIFYKQFRNKKGENVNMLKEAVILKLKSLILKNFRTYGSETKIDFDDLTVLIGKNDIGKSTILEALEIFFNGNLVKIESNDACVHNQDKNVTIGCIFTNLPNKIVLDASATTGLKEEYLLNQDGDLEIHKEFNCSQKSPKEKVYAVATHPSAELVNDLLTLKQQQLRKRLKDSDVDEDQIDLRSNPAMRRAIWENCSDLKLENNRIPLDKEDAKKIWDGLKKELPIFALFQADRPSKDEDTEVQDPMKVAVQEAIKSVESELSKIESIVKDKAAEVAKRTVDKLKDMDFALASELSPQFKGEPKWASLFKLTLTGDDEIPINKRGSGVRRLILLNFFRAEAERMQEESNSPGIIYAIEEPETSQHPSNQKLLVDSLLELSEQENCQVILTTHVPGLAGHLPKDSLRYIDKDNEGGNRIRSGNENEEVFKLIANDLGVLPDNRIRVFVCVEGPHDINFLKHISSMLHEHDTEIPDLSVDSRIAFVPIGGSTLKQWVQHHYLGALGRPEIHIYDRDTCEPPKYQKSVDQVNNRTDGSWATLTEKREMENYLHPDIINEVFNIQISFSDTDNVPKMVVEAVNSDPSNKVGPIKEARAKKLLNDKVAAKMTYRHLCESDPNKDIERWLRQIANRLE